MSVAEITQPNQNVVSIPVDVVSEDAMLVPINRLVYSPKHGEEHALGARAVFLTEKQAVMDQEVFNAGNKVDRALEAEKLVGKARRFMCSVLGVETREYANYRTASERRHGSRNFSNGNRSNIADSLEDVRKKLDARLEDKNLMFNDVYADQFPPFMRYAYEKEAGKRQKVGEQMPSPREWITERTDVGSERLINFLKYRVKVHEELQSNPRLHEIVNEQVADWLKGVRRGVAEGWLDADYDKLKRLSDEDLTVIFGDYFDLAARGYGGYALRDKAYMVVPHDPSGINHIAKHELNHALLGQLSGTWLDEALTEHIAQVINGHRSVEDIKSHGTYESGYARHANQDHSYRDTRDVLATLISIGGGELTMRDFTLAYSRNSYLAQHQLQQKVDRVFGQQDTLTKINDFVEKRKAVHMLDPKYNSIDALNAACRDLSGLLKKSSIKIFS